MAGLVGQRPTTTARLNGQQMEALLDTGSQVSTVSEDWFHQHLEGHQLHPVVLYIRAANGLPVPYVGVVLVELELFGQKIPDVPFLVLKDQPQQRELPGLIGMNVLGRCKSMPSYLQPMVRAERQKSAFSVARLSVSHHLPANSISTVRVTSPGSHPQLRISTRLSKPLPHGLILVPTLSDGERKQYVRLANLTDQDVILRGRTPVAIWEPADSVVKEEELQVTMDQMEIHVSPAAEIRPKSTIQRPEPPSDFAGTTEQWDALCAVLDEVPEAFQQGENDLGYTDIVAHRIPTVDEIPVNQPYRSIPPHMLQEVRSHLQGLKKSGVIIDSHSPYASPIVLVRKKDGSLRLCVDYRKLNSKTVGDAFPLPRIQETFDALAGAKYFSVLDLASGYHQIAMDTEDQHKTAFTTPFGLFEYTRMPFGLTSAPATFQRLIQRVMADQLFEYLLCYLDDILVYSKTFEEHLQHLRQILRKIATTGLKLRWEKCQFLAKDVTYLGHSISADGISCQDDKIQVVQKWPTPKTTTELRSFLGFASFYRRFVKNFAQIAGPLHDLTTKCGKQKRTSITSRWTPAHQDAFEKLKSALTTTPILGFADFSKPFIVQTDASKEGLGAILSQQQEDGRIRPIAYASRRLRPSEKSYYKTHHSSYKLEFLALKWAIADKFRHYLISTQFSVYTDNNALTYYRTAKLGAIEQRWASQLSAFHFDLVYKPGKMNPADPLSRAPVCTTELADCSAIAVEEVYSIALPHPACQPTPLPPELHCARHDIFDRPELGDEDLPIPEETPRQDPILEPEPEDLRQLQEEDDTIGPVLRAFPSKPKASALQPALKQLVRQYPRLFQDTNGVLRRRCRHPELGQSDQLVLPASMRKRVVIAMHDDMGHQGYDRTMQLLQSRVYWPGMWAEVKQHLDNCARCVIARPENVKTPIGHLSASRPLEVVAIDFTKMDMASDGTEDVLVLTDVFTKYAQAVPTRNQQASTVAKVLIDWFAKFGVPERIHSDRGRCFEAEVVMELLKQYNVHKSRTTPYHPMGNGCCERFNRTLHQLLRTLSVDEQARWPKHLPHLVMVYNSTPHAATGFSPYRLLFGRENRLPMDQTLQVPYGRDQDPTPVLRQANANIKRAEERGAKYADRGAKPQPLQAGDRVLVRYHGPGRNKIQHPYRPGLYIVERQLRPGQDVYCIRPVEGGPVSTRHRQQLKLVPPTLQEEEDSAELEWDDHLPPLTFLEPPLPMPQLSPSKDSAHLLKPSKIPRRLKPRKTTETPSVPETPRRSARLAQKPRPVWR